MLPQAWLWQWLSPEASDRPLHWYSHASAAELRADLHFGTSSQNPTGGACTTTLADIWHAFHLLLEPRATDLPAAFAPAPHPCGGM